MKKEILYKGIVIPLIIGIILGVAFFFVLRTTDVFKPVSSGTQIAYHDSILDSADVVLANSVDELEPNDAIGTISFGDSSLNLRYCCDYSNMISCYSLEKGSATFGEAGVAYLKAYAGNVENLGKKNITINSIFGTYKYKYVDSFEFKNEYEITSYMPNLGKSLVVYYQKSDGNGISSSYEAIVYEEVG
jgi:hypothetical protein